MNQILIGNNDSISAFFRKRRFSFFIDLISQVPKPCKIIDIGGTLQFWKTVGADVWDGIKLTFLNVFPIDVSGTNAKSVVGDARSIYQFGDNEFDVVFSNSTIEHVGCLDDQQKMANEVRRIGKRYFVQTPNKFFPVEPHFCFPFFQFLPVEMKIRLLSKLNLGAFTKTPDLEKNRRIVNDIRLLSKSEIKALFPEASLYHEKILGLSKSVIAYYGFT
jgi:hypothetical protein